MACHDGLLSASNCHINVYGSAPWRLSLETFSTLFLFLFNLVLGGEGGGLF